MNKALDILLLNNSEFTTDDFVRAFKDSFSHVSRSTIYAELKKLCDNNIITRKRKGIYSVENVKTYNYSLSEDADKLAKIIKKEYPLVNFQIWELYQLNEFVNHQISHNTIFVEVEDILDETIFILLHKKYRNVLFNPTIDEYYRYMGDTTIVVQKLISEAPQTIDDMGLASLEKILVDLFSRGLVSKLIERAEYRGIYEYAFAKYNINEAKMFRYARRRGVADRIRKYINEETDIHFEG